MTNSVSKFVMDSPVKAVLDGEVIDVFYQSPIAKDKKSIDKAKREVSSLVGQLQYGVCRWLDRNNDVQMLAGAEVCRIPQEYGGVCSEHEEDEFEAIGTLLLKDGAWYVETDEEVVEMMRRNKEYESMKAGTLHIGKFGYDHLAYRAELEAKDAEKGSTTTRGHGVSFL